MHIMLDPIVVVGCEVTIDASGMAVGIVLSQENHPLFFIAANYRLECRLPHPTIMRCLQSPQQ